MSLFKNEQGEVAPFIMCFFFFFKLVTSNYYVLLKFFSQPECIEKHQYKFICPDFTLLI